MVKFVTDIEEDGRRRLGFGLEEGNLQRLLQRLREDKPIHIRLDDPNGINIGLPIDILIFYGATHADLVDTVRPYLSERTVVIRNTRDGREDHTTRQT